MLLVVDILLSVAWAFGPRHDLRDFGSFIASGRAANRGENPYGVYAETFVVDLGDRLVPSPNLNPPISIYPFRLLAHVAAKDAMRATRIVSLLLFAAIVALGMRREDRLRTPLFALWLFSLAGFWHTIELGQIYMVLVVMSTAALFLSPTQPILAGLLIGMVVATKPGFVVWPALLLLAGYRRAGVTSIVTAGALSLMPLLIEGPAIYRQWFAALHAFTGMEVPGNGSLLAITTRAGLAPLGVVLSVLLLATLAAWTLRTRPDAREASMAGILAALVLGPITWPGYSLFAVPFLVTRSWGWWEKVAAALLVVPYWLVFVTAEATPLTSFLIGPIYGWAILMMLAMHCFAVDQKSRQRPAYEPPLDSEANVLAAA